MGGGGFGVWEFRSSKLGPLKKGRVCYVKDGAVVGEDAGIQ
jgi:hypothetical protein